MNGNMQLIIIHDFNNKHGTTLRQHTENRGLRFHFGESLPLAWSWKKQKKPHMEGDNRKHYGTLFLHQGPTPSLLKEQPLTQPKLGSKESSHEK